MAPPCLRWHGFAFGLGRHIFLSHKHTHTLIQEGNTGSQRCLETHTDTHTNTHNGQHWFPVWHYLAVSDTAEGSGYSLDPTMQTNKHSMHSLSLINIPRHFIDSRSQTITSDRKQLILIITTLTAWSLVFCSSSSQLRFYCLSLCILLMLRMYLSPSVSISAFIKRNGFFLASRSGVDCLAGLAQCWAIQQVNMFYQPHGSSLTNTHEPQLSFCFFLGG